MRLTKFLTDQLIAGGPNWVDLTKLNPNELKAFDEFEKVDRVEKVSGASTMIDMKSLEIVVPGDKVPEGSIRWNTTMFSWPNDINFEGKIFYIQSFSKADGMYFLKGFLIK